MPVIAPLKEEDELCMQLDLRSEEKENRTMHLFVNGEQQKVFITGVPDTVTFGVCCIIFVLLLISSFLFVLSNIFRYPHYSVMIVLNLLA